MIFLETPLAGAFVIEPERLEDERGFFARTFCAEEFARRGLETSFPQCSLSHNRHRLTLRGMHFQAPPHEEAKLLRCAAGVVYDVILDLRPESRTFGRWHAVELSAESLRALYIPKGFAHGFETLTEDAQVFYQISVPYHPEFARGIRWDDPAFAIEWPGVPPRMISERDRSFPDFHR